MIRLLLLWLLAPWVWAAPNFVEEAALVSGLQASLQPGRLIALQSGERSFTAIWDEARSAQPAGCAIVLPEAGARADSAALEGLRTVLPAHGWSVLSLQLPVLEAEAGEAEYLSLLPEARRRTEAAVAYLQSRGIENPVLVGHGFGALVALAYVRGGGKSIGALVLMSPWFGRGEMTAWLGGLRIPVLDIHGERDRPEVLAATAERHRLLKKLPAFRQWRISGAGHDYRGRETLLGKRIYGWLKSAAALPPGERRREDPVGGDVR